MAVRIGGRGRIMVIALSGLLAVGVVGAGSVAMAEGPGDGSGSPAARQGEGRHRPNLLHIAVHDIVKASGIAPEVFRQGAKDGKSLSQIISENGGDPHEVERTVLHDLTVKVREAVANGKLRPEQAERILEKAPDALSRLMNAVPRPNGGNPGVHPPQGILKNAIQTAATTIGIDEKDLVNELRAGKSIAQVASEHGSSGREVIEALAARANAAIAEAVASGKLEASKADEAKARALAAITKLVNEPRPHAPRAQG